MQCLNCRDSVDAGTPRKGLPGTQNKPEGHPTRCALLSLPKGEIVILVSVLGPVYMEVGDPR